MEVVIFHLNIIYYMKEMRHLLLIIVLANSPRLVGFAVHISGIVLDARDNARFEVFFNLRC